MMNSHHSVLATEDHLLKLLLQITANLYGHIAIQSGEDSVHTPYRCMTNTLSLIKNIEVLPYIYLLTPNTSQKEACVSLRHMILDSRTMSRTCKHAK